jgi:hypothetical protein
MHEAFIQPSRRKLEKQAASGAAPAFISSAMRARRKQRRDAPDELILPVGRHRTLWAGRPEAE